MDDGFPHIQCGFVQSKYNFFFLLLVDFPAFAFSLASSIPVLVLTSFMFLCSVFLDFDDGLLIFLIFFNL